LIGITLSGCSAVLDVDRLQCDDDSECVTARLGTLCIDRVCSVETPSPLPEERSEPELPEVGLCAADAQCSDGAAPRCLGGECVGEAEAVRWMCAGSRAPVQDGTLVDYQFRVYEFVSRRPPAKLSVKACRTNDVSCASAVAEFNATAPDGLVTLQLPLGFVGYFALDADGSLPQRFHLTRPLRESQVRRPVQMISPATLSLLSDVAGESVNTGTGLVIIEAIDCSGRPAGGIHFEESTGDALPFYVVNLLPTAAVSVSVHDEVNDIASAGFFNAEPGLTTITASLGEDGPMIAVFNAQVRANSVTLIELSPDAP
jgi:hypothetical protein